MYYLLYCLVYLTYSAVWRSVLSTFYTYYLSIHLALKETCMYLVKLVLFVPLFFLILVLSKLFFLFPLYVLYVLYTQTQSHAIFCLFVVQQCSQVVLTLVVIYYFFQFFCFHFLCSKSLSFHSAVSLYSILLLHTYDMQIML